jgi:hypothetical protein
MFCGFQNRKSKTPRGGGAGGGGGGGGACRLQPHLLAQKDIESAG